MSPESTSEHQSRALSSTARHLTQRDFPGSDEVFQKIKALIGGKSTENIPQIQKLLEEMQTAYSKRISNLLSNIQNGSIRIRDAHQEVQQMLHEIQVFKGNDMPEEVAAVTEAITSMCAQIAKKVQAVKELINETPVAAPAVMAPAEPVETITPDIVAPIIAAPEADQSKEKLLATWNQEIINYTKGNTLTRKLLLAIAEKSAKGESITRANLATQFGVEERVVNYTLQNWKQSKMNLSFILRTSNPHKIYQKNQEAPIIAAPKPVATAALQLAPNTSETKKKSWLEAIRTNSKDGTGTRKALEHIVATYETGTTWEELMSITGQGTPKLVYDCLRAWWSDKKTRMPFTLTIIPSSKIRIFQKAETLSVAEPAAEPPKALILADKAETVDTDPALKTKWLEYMREHTRNGKTRIALAHIIDNYPAATAWEDLATITRSETAVAIYNCIIAWRTRNGNAPFKLHATGPKVIISNNSAASIEPSKEEASKSPLPTKTAPIIESPIAANEQVEKWLKEAEENSAADSTIRKILTHVITNYTRVVSMEELMKITGHETKKQVLKCMDNWRARHGKNTSIRIMMVDSGIKMVSEITPPTPVTKADIAAPAPTPVPIAIVTPAPRIIPPTVKASPIINAVVETSTAPIEWLNEINRISSPGTSSRKILVSMTNNNNGKEVSWAELLRVSGEEVETQQLEKRIGRWQEKFARNAPFKIVTSTSGAKMVPKDAPEEVSPVQTPKVITTATVAAVIATITEPQPVIPPKAPLTEAETSGHQGKAMIWISKLPPGRMTEKVVYEALAGKFGTEVTKEELMNVEKVYNRERMIGRIDMISFIYRLDNDRVPFSEMPFTIARTEKGFKMMQKETKKVQTAGPLPEATPEQVRKEKAMRWVNNLNLDSSMILYGFLKTLAENPSAKISDRKILEGARRINPKMTTDDLYTLFSDAKKRGKIRSAIYPMSNYTLDIEMKSQRTDDADKYFFKLHEIRL